MPRHLAIVAYDGSRYLGWQRQPHGPTIQAALENALQAIFQRPVAVQGASRTDAGVHARGQACHFDLETDRKLRAILGGLNAILPPDIAVQSVARVTADFHARYGPVSKWYRYTIRNHPLRGPFDLGRAHYVRRHLDQDAMRRAAEVLKGRHDFACFQTDTTKLRAKGSANTVRTLHRLELAAQGEYLYLDVEGDAFLYHMVRAIAGTLVDVGLGRLRPEDMQAILASHDRCAAGPNLPAQGLCLMRVSYPARQILEAHAPGGLDVPAPISAATEGIPL